MVDLDLDYFAAFEFGLEVGEPAFGQVLAQGLPLDSIRECADQMAVLLTALPQLLKNNKA